MQTAGTDGGSNRTKAKRKKRICHTDRERKSNGIERIIRAVEGAKMQKETERP